MSYLRWEATNTIERAVTSTGSSLRLPRAPFNLVKALQSGLLSNAGQEKSRQFLAAFLYPRAHGLAHGDSIDCPVLQLRGIGFSVTGAYLAHEDMA